ncbi:MAG: hypothetical protein VB934_10800, partial [Polyangiaceae bacterium]
MITSVVLLTLASSQPMAEKPATPASVFQQFQNLTGAWNGKSTKGWEEVSTIKAIAGGSVVVFSSFEIGRAH